MVGKPLTTSFNAGMSLQALMALLGHVSTEMTLRYASLAAPAIRIAYEEAMNKARARLTLPIAPAGQPILAVVGRPNVGKSTLVNAIVGSHVVIVSVRPRPAAPKTSSPAPTTRPPTTADRKCERAERVIAIESGGPGLR